jgi:hypothetical protein
VSIKEAITGVQDDRLNMPLSQDEDNCTSGLVLDLSVDPNEEAVGQEHSSEVPESWV